MQQAVHSYSYSCLGEKETFILVLVFFLYRILILGPLETETIATAQAMPRRHTCPSKMKVNDTQLHAHKLILQESSVQVTDFLVECMHIFLISNQHIGESRYNNIINSRCIRCRHCHCTSASA